MRILIVLFGGLVLWGLTSFQLEDAGLPKWPAAVTLTALGIVLQLSYARAVNAHFDRTGMPDSIRLRLRSDFGMVPWSIASLGISARICLAGGVLIPLLEYVGCFARGRT